MRFMAAGLPRAVGLQSGLGRRPVRSQRGRKDSARTLRRVILDLRCRVQCLGGVTAGNRRSGPLTPGAGQVGPMTTTRPVRRLHPPRRVRTWRPVTARCGRSPSAWPRRSRPRTRPSRRCPTSARPSGTWRTPRGSSRPSCWRAAARLRGSTRRTASCSTPTTRRSAPAPPSAQGAITRPAGRGRRLPRASTRRCRLLDGGVDGRSADLVELGLHHEEQHQELLLMDIKHVLAANPLRPSTPATAGHPAREPPGARLDRHPAGSVRIGHDGRRLRLRQRGAPPRRAPAVLRRAHRAW